MTPYQVHLDAWTLAMYATDDGRLTFTVSNSEEGEHYLTRVVGNVKLRRYYIGDMCAGELPPSPSPARHGGKPDGLPTDGNKITPSMLDSKADLKALIDGAEIFRDGHSRIVEVVETIEPIVSSKSVPGFSLTHGYLI